jgi:hypothetical protein
MKLLTGALIILAYVTTAVYISQFIYTHLKPTTSACIRISPHYESAQSESAECSTVPVIQSLL